MFSQEFSCFFSLQRNIESWMNVVEIRMTNDTKKNLNCTKIRKNFLFKENFIFCGFKISSSFNAKQKVHEAR
jgi:hypothetical protein